MELAEPTTALTDLVLSLLAFGFALQLIRYSNRVRQKSIRDWGIAFGALAIGALSGGVSHGLAPYMSDTTYAVVWRVTLYSIGIASFYMLSGMARAALRYHVGSWVILVAVIKLSVYLYRCSVTPSFQLAVYDYVPNMAAVLVMGVVLRKRHGDASGIWIAAGVVISFVAAGVQLAGVALHAHFNHNDLYHVIQMGSLALFHRGAANLQDMR